MKKATTLNTTWNSNFINIAFLQGISLNENYAMQVTENRINNRINDKAMYLMVDKSKW